MSDRSGLSSRDLKRALSLNEPVAIECLPARTDNVLLACGLDMLKGAVVVE